MLTFILHHTSHHTERGSMTFQRFGLANAILPILFLGSTASFQLTACYLYLNKKPNFMIVVLLFGITTGIYLLNRIVDNEDKFNNLSRWQFFNGTVTQRCFWISVSVFALLLPVLIPLYYKKTGIALIFLGISISGLFYSIKLVPFIQNRKLKWICLKEIPVIKTLVVCFIWGISALVLSVTDVNFSLLRNDILFILFILFISSLNSTVASDVRDVIGDRMRRIYTIPVMIGTKSTFMLLAITNLIAFALSAFLLLENIISLKLALFGIIIPLWAAISTMPQYFNYKKISKTTMELLIDSETLVCAIGLLILS